MIKIRVMNNQNEPVLREWSPEILVKQTQYRHNFSHLTKCSTTTFRTNCWVALLLKGDFMKKYKVMFCKYETIEIDDAKTENEAIDKAVEILEKINSDMRRYDEVEVEEEEIEEDNEDEDGNSTNNK